MAGLKLLNLIGGMHSQAQGNPKTAASPSPKIDPKKAEAIQRGVNESVSDKNARLMTNAKKMLGLD